MAAATTRFEDIILGKNFADESKFIYICWDRALLLGHTHVDLVSFLRSSLITGNCTSLNAVDETERQRIISLIRANALACNIGRKSSPSGAHYWIALEKLRPFLKEQLADTLELDWAYVAEHMHAMWKQHSANLWLPELAAYEEHLAELSARVAARKRVWEELDEEAPVFEEKRERKRVRKDTVVAAAAVSQ